MSHDFEFAVVGAGATGSACAYQLARDGKSTVLFEQFEIGHERGSSHGNSRIFRLSYEHPAYVKMAYAAQKLWRTLENEAQCELLTQTGGLDLGLESNAMFASCMSSMDKNGIPYERLAATQLRERFPQFEVGDDMLGIYQDSAGILNAGECVKAMVKVAKERGAEIKANCPVLVIEPTELGLRLITENGNFTCKKVIVNAGAWAGALLEPLGINLPLRITKEQYLFFTTNSPEIFQRKQCPIFTEYGALAGSADIGMYGFPLFERDAVKVASHQAGPVTTANMRTFEIESDRADVVRAYVKKRLPRLVDDIIEAKTCLYSNTPDEHFVIDTACQHPHVTVVSACSGHGFKFAVLTGRIAADLALNNRTDFDIDLFTLARFSQRTT